MSDVDEQLDRAQALKDSKRTLWMLHSLPHNPRGVIAHWKTFMAALITSGGSFGDMYVEEPAKIAD